MDYLSMVSFKYLSWNYLLSCLLTSIGTLPGQTMLRYVQYFCNQNVTLYIILTHTGTVKTSRNT